MCLEFIKYVDGFEKAGARIGHAINKSFFPLKTEFAQKLEQEVGIAPNEEDYDDDDDYEDALDRYKTRKREASCSLQMNVCNTMSLFDSKTRKLDILKNGTFRKVVRSDLIAGYLGQTALKTTKVIDEACNISLSAI